MSNKCCLAVAYHLQGHSFMTPLYFHTQKLNFDCIESTISSLKFDGCYHTLLRFMNISLGYDKLVIYIMCPNSLFFYSI